MMHIHSSVCSTYIRTLLALACFIVAIVGADTECHTAGQLCGDEDEGVYAAHAHTPTTMLLQMHHHLAPNRSQPVSVLETCPLDKFQSSLTYMIENKLFLESNITNSAQTRYLELAEVQQCYLGPEWWVSQKPLVINAGDGSTATRWLDEIMMDLGFNTQHSGFYEEKSLGFASTAAVDEFDYISDTPVSSLTWQLLQSHPKALFLMTMRDPEEWQDHRGHDHGDSDLVLQGLPCDGADQLQFYHSQNLSARTYVAYSAWAKCVIPENQFIGAVNVFADENNGLDFVEKLIHMFETHGLQKPDWEKRAARVRSKVADRLYDQKPSMKKNTTN